MQEGIVIKSTGSWYSVRTKDGTIYNSRIIGKFRLEGKKVTNPVAVGDQVMISIENDDTAQIKKILPRQNYVARQSPRKKHFLHIIASNIDQAILFITIAQPKLKQGFIDRFLLMMEPHNIPTTIVFNKADVYDEEDMRIYEVMEYIYEAIGYQVLLTSAENGKGMEDLKILLKDKITLISGQSGVGKSTALNALQSTLDLKTADISDYSGKGQHTTTFAEMHPLDFGGYVIDTPGIKTLAFTNLEPMDVAHNFREFFEASKDCKFHDCSHRNEPKCAVKDGIEGGTISELRYLNYIQILEEIEDQNYWERHKDM